MDSVCLVDDGWARVRGYNGIYEAYFSDCILPSMGSRTLYLVAGILAILAGAVQLSVALFDKYGSHKRELIIGILFVGLGIAVLLRRRTLK